MTGAELDRRFAELLDGAEPEQPVAPSTEAGKQMIDRPEPTIYTAKLAQCAIGQIDTSIGFKR